MDEVCTKIRVQTWLCWVSKWERSVLVVVFHWSHDWCVQSVVCLQIFEYLKSQKDFVGSLLHHIGTSAIMDLLLRLITCIESPDTRHAVIEVGYCMFVKFQLGECGWKGLVVLCCITFVLFLCLSGLPVCLLSLYPTLIPSVFFLLFLFPPSHQHFSASLSFWLFGGVCFWLSHILDKY